VCFSEPAVIGVFVYPSVDIAEDENLDFMWLNVLALENTFLVFEKRHPSEEPQCFLLIKHKRELFCSLSFDVSQEAHTGPFVLLTGNHPAVNHVMRVIDQPLLQPRTHTFPNSCSKGVGSFGGSLGIANFALAAGVNPNSLARALICSASCF